MISKYEISCTEASRAAVQPEDLPGYSTGVDIWISSPISPEQGWTLLLTHPANSHLPVLVQKSAGGSTDNSKTNVVVPVVGIVPVAIRRTAVPRIVVPRTTAQEPEVPTPSSLS
jgi:hypothetical protein